MSQGKPQESNMMDQQQTPSHIVVHQDSQLLMDKLFMAPFGSDSRIPLSKPLRQRKLPDSFFKPREGGSKSASHSRESSLDAAYSPQPNQVSSPLSPASPLSQVPVPSQQVINRLNISHSRAHSSPATLQQTFSVAPAPANQAVQHIRQLSYEIESCNLPPGWDMAKTETGQRFFINHNEQQTTWTDPRQQLLQQQVMQQQQRLTSPPAANTISNINALPLPKGWDKGYTPEGEVYFIDHANQTTSWFDPRIPIHLQKIHEQRNIRRDPPPAMPLRPSTGAITRAQDTELSNLQQQLRQRQIQQLNSNLFDGINNSNCATTTGVDPFLGGASGGGITADGHSRQESADSGLGLGNYSLPHTPEDFLNNIDDHVSSGDENRNSNQPSDMGLDNLAVANLDLGADNMDSDDLVPSLSEELGADIPLSDIEALLSSNNNRDNLLTWL